jgi:hypothetical protein
MLASERLTPVGKPSQYPSCRPRALGVLLGGGRRPADAAWVMPAPHQQRLRANGSAARWLWRRQALSNMTPAMPSIAEKLCLMWLATAQVPSPGFFTG